MAIFSLNDWVGAATAIFPPLRTLSSSAQGFSLPQARGRHRHFDLNSPKQPVSPEAAFFPPMIALPLPTTHFFAQKIPCRRGRTIFFRKKFNFSRAFFVNNNCSYYS
jgi:hypothetical protein